MEFNLGSKNNNQQEQPKQLEQLPNESQSQNNQSQPDTSTKFSDDSQPDWENAPMPEEVEEVPEPPPNVQQEDVVLNDGSYIISYDVFHKGFQKTFLMAGIAFQLQTLAAAGEQDSCPDASRAIYDIILETPSLKWILRPESIWLQRIFAIGSFALPVAAGCAMEIRMKKAQAEETQKTTQQQSEEGEVNDGEDASGWEENANHWSERTGEEHQGESSV